MPVRDPQIVTPEAVVLEFRTAGLGSRSLARLLDGAIQLATLLLILGVLAGISRASGGLGTGAVVLILLSIFLLIFGYPAIWETLWRGRTPGKAALGLRVLTREGAPIRFRHAAIRSALQVVDLLVVGPAIGVLSMLFSSEDQRVGDVVAGTLVIRERGGARAPTAVAFPVPYGCEEYVARLEVAGLAGSDYETVRSFLVRAGSLDPAVRWDLAARLAVPLAQRLHHTPPDWMPPDLFLACLAAAAQRRPGEAPVAPAQRQPGEAPVARPTPPASGPGGPPPPDPAAGPAHPPGGGFAPPG